MRRGRSRGGWRDLITAVVGPKEGGWTVRMWIDAPLERGHYYATVEQLVAEALSSARGAYPEDRSRERAEVQFAIYPSDEGSGGTIFDVTGTPPHLVATELNGAARRIEGGSLDDLIRNASPLVDFEDMVFRRIVMLATTGE